ncbi:acyltransferase family protein [Paraburkholderia phenoliruptrix]|nr:acyltransferase [Paraburkholderia phenoliruptrix]CAB4052764.1 hypothetical protein LMG9964_06454 [Paraburkholderia phenoliruptrix]
MGKNLPIQYLRAFAALLVVAFHAPATIAAFGNSLPLLRAGAYGVDIFFVISGFIMGATGASGGSSRADFILKRLVRIVPLYWITTLCTVALAVLAPGLMRSTVIDISSVGKSLFFIPHFSHAHPGNVWPIVVPGWTLNFEMFFYALVAVVIPFATRARAVAISVIFLMFIAAGFAFHSTNAIFLTYTNTLLFEFILGMWIAIFHHRGRLPNRWLALPIFLFGCVLLFAADATSRGFTKGIPAAMIVLGALVILRDFKSQILEYIGDASYAIYLVQFFSFGIVRALWTLAGVRGTTPVHAMLYVALSVIGCVISGLAVYALVERPMTRYLKQLIQRLARTGRVRVTDRLSPIVGESSRPTMNSQVHLGADGQP